MLQKLLAEKFRYVEVVSFEGQISQIGQDIETVPESLPRNGNGFSTLTQIFVDKVQECSLAAGSAENYEHWELVRKIGLAALGQGREDDED